MCLLPLALTDMSSVDIDIDEPICTGIAFLAPALWHAHAGVVGERRMMPCMPRPIACFVCKSSLHWCFWPYRCICPDISQVVLTCICSTGLASLDFSELSDRPSGLLLVNVARMLPKHTALSALFNLHVYRPGGLLLIDMARMCCQSTQHCLLGPTCLYTDRFSC